MSHFRGIPRSSYTNPSFDLGAINVITISKQTVTLSFVVEPRTPASCVGQSTQLVRSHTRESANSDAIIFPLCFSDKDGIIARLVMTDTIDSHCWDRVAR